MKHFLVDYENIGSKELTEVKEISKKSSVAIFYSATCKTKLLDALTNMSNKGVALSFHKITTGTKNALDFQLSSYLGYLIGNGKQKDKFYIVSKDKGFDCVVTFWNKQEVKLRRIAPETVTEKTKQKPKKKKKSKQSKEVTLKQLQSMVSEGYPLKEIMEIVNQSKTKTEVHNELSRLFRDNKKATTVYHQLKPLLKKGE